MKNESFVKYFVFSKIYLKNMVFEKVYVDWKQAEKLNPHSTKKQPTNKIPKKPQKNPNPQNYEVISLDTAGNVMNCGKQTHLKLGEAEHYFRIFPLLI